MRQRFFIATLFALTLLLPGVAAAQAWTQPRGEGYYRLGLRALQARHFYDPGGTRVPITTVGDYVASVYAEYGITDRITAVAYAPFFERITLNELVGRPSGTVVVEGDAASGIADPTLGVRYGVLRGGPAVVSLGLQLGLPLGQDEQPNGLITGDGEFNQLVSVAAGYSFYPRPVYAMASVGFNNRTRGFSDEVAYQVEGGVTWRQTVLVIGRLRGSESLENGSGGTGPGGIGGLYSNNVRYLTLGAEVAYLFAGGYGVAVGAETAVYGQNVLSAPVFTVGFFLDR